MSDPKLQRAQAEAEAAVARERVAQTLAQLQARLKPKRLAQEAWREVSDAGSDAARASIATARRRPGLVAGIAAAAALIAARRPLFRLARRPFQATTNERTS